MKIGLKKGATGEDVGRLHRVLQFAGFMVAAVETEVMEFGESTLYALRELMRERGHRGEVEEIDVTAQTTLIEIERTIVIEDGGAWGAAPPVTEPNPREGVVKGVLADGDGAPVAGAKIELFSHTVRNAIAIRHGATGKDGRYSIRYERNAPLNLSVTASDAEDKVLASSPTTFAAAREIEIDLTTAADGVVRTPSQYTVLVGKVVAALGDLKLTDLHENKDVHELTFLASSIGVPFVQVGSLYVAQVMSGSDQLKDQTLFGLFLSGTPASLSAGLQHLPDAGIDAAFCSQVLAAVLTHGRADLAAMLTGAVTKNVLPGSYSKSQTAELDLLDALREASVAAGPYVRGKTPLKDLLSAGAVTDAAQAAFVKAYAANGKHLGGTWRTLRADKTLTAPELATLKSTLAAGDLMAGNLPLVKDTLARLGDQSLASVGHLAMLDQADWEARTRAVDPQAASLRAMLPAESDEQRVANFAKILTRRFTSRFPTLAFAGGLSKATTSTFRTKDELVSFATTQTKFNLRKSNIDAFLRTNQVSLSTAAVAELKTAQRLHRVSPHYASVETLLAAGHTSAQSIYFQGRAPFLAAMTRPLGSEAMAKMAYARAQMTYATALMTMGRYNIGLNGLGTASFAPRKPAKETLDQLPDLQALFGSLDSFACDDCQSVYSPAAYLVDLLQYLGWFAATPLPGAPAPASSATDARAALLLRRPEIAHVALSCNNTNIVIPYIDLVNEILEAAVAPPAVPPASIETEGTTAERRALPQQTQPDVYKNAYARTKQIVFPLGLPFDVDFARTTAYIAALGTTRLALLNLFSAVTVAEALSGAALGLNQHAQTIIATADNVTPFTRWGLAESPGTFVDPKTRQLKTPNPDNWIGALNNVPFLKSCTGLSLQQLYQLLEVVWVTQSGVTLQLGETTSAGLSILSADTDLMVFTGLDGAVLDRANRFLRLLNATGLEMWELDWALELPQVAAMDQAALTFLAGAVQVQTQLSLPFQQVLTFWSATMETRDVLSHLGNEDVIVPSTYSTVFGNVTMTASFPSFQPASALSGQPILVAGQPPAADLIPLNGISAALGLSGTDIAAILSATGAENKLNLAVLTVLHRYARLASSLSLAVPDLILFIALTDGSPFGGSPADTVEFLRRLDVLQTTSIAVHDLDYLLRGQSVTQSAMAVTDAQIAMFLQTIQSAVVKAGPAPDAPTIESIVLATLVAATGASAAVIAPVLSATAVLPLDAATLAKLLVSATPQPSDFPKLAAAYSSVAKAAALCTALSIDPGAFAFLVANAARFGWLNPASLPLTPLPVSPYAAFECMVQALKLQSRQAARTPKLFDVLGQWIIAVPPDIATAIGGPQIVVMGASDVAGNPIEITTVAAHGLTTGTQVAISGVEGNAAANGTFTITVVGPAQFTLNGSVGSGPWTAGGTVVSLAAPAIALALNASITDVTAIAGALKAAAPPAGMTGLTGTLADIGMLSTIANALDVVARYGIQGSTLVKLADAVPDEDTANAAMGTLQAQYPQSIWLAAVQPVEDNLRQMRRDALVAYLLGPGPAVDFAGTFLTSDDIFDYYLIDPEMCACGETTRLLQPSLAIQQFVQQAFLNLNFGVKSVDTTDTRWSEWSWRSQYRMWQANREVFLYPENYVLPELRRNASPFFKDLESDLRQSNCDADAAEAAFENYLRKLVNVSRMHVAAHYNQVNPDGSSVLHVFARTRGTPGQWFYRTRTTVTRGAAGTWAAWTSLNLDIASDQLVPVVWDRRLYLIWPIFKQLSEKAASQDVPKAGGNSSQTARQMWSVQFAMSEYSAGQWQAKRVIDEKMYFDITDPASSFMFKAVQLPNFDLQLQVFYTGSGYNTDGLCWYAAQGEMSFPDAPLSVTQVDVFTPTPYVVDLKQEPTFTLIKKVNLLYQGVLVITLAPYEYGFNGQDLVYGSWGDVNPGQVPLWVMSTTTAAGGEANVQLLGQINNPRVVIPQQEINFDALDPFFVSDGSRTYLVQPDFYTISNYPQELNDLTYVPRWTTRFEFETFYHPYARTFLRELEIGGIPQLMSRTLQTQPETVRAWPSKFDFKGLFKPLSPVATPYPGQANAPDPGETALDFDAGSSGAYSLYNWEIFYHAPMFVASLLTQNMQFKDTLTWLEYIFNPTDKSGGETPGRYWQMAPFNAMHADQWTAEQIQNLLTTLAAKTQQGISDPATANAIAAWMADPYDPHMVASTRISAYGKATVMKFLDNLIAWGDSLYAQYTSETVSQAEQLYIFADMILGPAPDQVRRPSSQQTAAPTYASLQNIDPFSNVLLNVENLIIAPTPPSGLVEGTSTGTSLPQFPGNGNTLLFCIPPNDQLLAYWGSVAQRLYNIRHCLNLQGIAQPLPLYAPPINPLQLIAAQGAGGAGASSTPAVAPIYRFTTYLQKAAELTSEVRSYGSAILSALEKQDSETLSTLRATHEINIQTLILDVKTHQLTEAQDQIAVLQNQKAVTQIRSNYYSNIAFMNPWEITAMSLQGAALIANAVGLILDMTAGVSHLAPSVMGGAAGFGGSPTVTVIYGGENIGHSATSWSNVARSIGGLLSEGGGMASTMGSYRRRQDDWGLQASLANAELTQIDSQIAAANDRVLTANSDLTVQNKQIENAQAISDFLTNKYTNAQLYNWMISQLTTVYTQAYQLAYSLSLQAQTAYQYELGRPTDEFIGFAYWDSQHRGLTAGDSLLFDLRRMEAQYLRNNAREMEITMQISLALTQPNALLQLLQSGSCTISLDESIFDHAYPGQYFRRLRSVALTVPCVTGPYTGVHAMLSLSSSVIRTAAPGNPYSPYSWSNPADVANPPEGVTAAPAVAATPIIATSTGQNDAGLFEVNLRDERWLPFEGQGAVSQWSLSLDPRDNDFDTSTITDVILHLRYSARFGGNAETVRKALKPNSRTILISTRSTFSNAYFSFFHPADVAATQQTLVLPLTANIFPYSNLGTPKITGLDVYMVLAQPVLKPIAAVAMNATFDATGSATPAAIKFIPVQDAPGGGGAETAAGGGPVAALFSPTSVTAGAPGSYTLTLPQSSLPTGPAILQALVSGQERLDMNQFDDIVLIVSYDLD